jgi:hypothetical protein
MIQGSRIHAPWLAQWDPQAQAREPMPPTSRSKRSPPVRSSISHRPHSLEPPLRMKREAFPPVKWNFPAARDVSSMQPSVLQFLALRSSWAPQLPALPFRPRRTHRPASESWLLRWKSYPGLWLLRPWVAQTWSQTVFGRVRWAAPFQPAYPPISASRIETLRAESRIPK